MSTRSEAEVVNTEDQEQPGVSQQPSSPTINPLNPNGQPSGIGDQTATAKNDNMEVVGSRKSSESPPPPPPTHPEDVPPPTPPLQKGKAGPGER